MKSDEIVRTLLQKLPDDSEIVYSVTMRDLLSEIARRLQDESLKLTVDELLLARDELRATFGHYLDERELFDLALDQWDLVRSL